MERWRGKVAVVTGASAGIGAALLTTLAQHGLICIGLARSAHKIQALADKSKGRIYAVQCDVTKEEDIKNAFKWVQDNHGGVDLLINNAGIFKLTHISEAPTSLLCDTFNINVIGYSLCIREALKTMRERGDDGHIINMSSIVGHTLMNLDKIGVYAASKHAIRAISEAMRIELTNLGSQIKVSNVSPAAVFTEMGVNVVKEGCGQSIDLPLDGDAPPGFLSAQDVADAVVSIISFKSNVQVHDMIFQGTGQII